MIRRGVHMGGVLLALGAMLLAAPAARAQGGHPTPVHTDVLPTGVCVDGNRQAAYVAASTTRIAVRCLLNKLRARHGLPRMSPHPALQRAADQHARDMAWNEFFGHVGLDGTRVADRIDAVSRWRDWRWAGEVIGWACAKDSAPRAMVSAWWASAAHRRTILARRARRIGVGTAPGTPFGCDGVTWTIAVGGRY